MENAKRLFPVLILLAAFPCLLAAQKAPLDGGESATRVVKTGEGFELFQRITFPEVSGMLRYEVEIEQLAGDSFVPLERVQTESSEIEVSLKAGSYRYRVFAYNKMNLLDAQSDWQDFTVRAAVEPVAETYQPFYGLYYEMADPEGSITVRGRDLFPESEFAVVKQKGDFDWSGISLEGRKDVIVPARVSVGADHTTAVLDFARKQLKKGEYYIFVRNPGGLWTVLGGLRVAARKDADWTLSFGWSPMIAAFDYEKARYHEYSPFYGHEIDKQRLDRFNAKGAYLRLGWIPAKTTIGNFGLELNMLFLADREWAADSDDSSAGDRFWEMLTAGHLDVVYQKPDFFRKDLQLELRAGLGGGDDYVDRDNTGSDTGSEFPLFWNLGFSVQYFIWKNFYAEAGIDFLYATGPGYLMIHPVLGIGWQFGRWAEYKEVTNLLKQGEDPSVPVTGIPKNEITLSVGWAPVITLSDYTFTHTGTYWNGSSWVTHEEERTDLKTFNPAGAYLRAACLPYRWGNNKLGFEFAFFILDYYRRVKTENKAQRMVALMRGAQGNILYQRKLREDWQLNARLGAGIGHPYQEGDGVALTFNGGLSVQRFFVQGFYAEAGLDLIASSYVKTRWMLSPAIGIGWQFNRDAETGLRLK
ncbi:MAG: hypothetical protein LBB82_03560 [Treponema sp.]|jgi:hypothetical protein|nr:hypothetical protein [Treponema sp.]